MHLLPTAVASNSLSAVLQSNPAFLLSTGVGFGVAISILTIVAIGLMVEIVRLCRRTSPKPPRFEVLQSLQWPIAMLAMTAAFLTANHLLLRGLAVGIWDINLAYLPYQTLVADFARAGQLLHWDPWSNAGQPSGGDPQFGAFSPLSLLIGLIGGGTSRAFLFYWLFIWWLGGIGMMLLARHLKATPWLGAAIALGFLFCGVNIGQAEHTSLIYTYAFLPLTVWRLDVAVRSRRLSAAVQCGALWGNSALAGYPGMVIISGMFLAFWAAGRALFPDPIDEAVNTSDSGAINLRSRLRFSALSLTIVVVVGVAVLMPTYLAYFYETVGTSRRVGALPRETAVGQNHLAPGAIATIASPYLPVLKVLSQGESRLWKQTDVSGCGLYLGSIIWVFALFALVSRPRGKWRWWLFGLALLNLAFAVGPALPLRGWLYDLFYPTRFFRHSAMFRAYFLFPISVLALIGSRDYQPALFSGIRSGRRNLLIVSVLVAGAMGFIFYYYMGPMSGIERASRLLEPLAWQHIFIVWLGLCLIAAVPWMVSTGVRTWAVPLLLVILATSDAVLTTALSVGIYVDASPSAVERWNELDRRHSSDLEMTAKGLRRDEKASFDGPGVALEFTNDQMITKAAAFNTYATAINNIHVAMADDFKLRNIALGANRIWFAKTVSHLPPTPYNFSSFANIVSTFDRIPIVVHSDVEMRQAGGALTYVASDKEVEISRLPGAVRVPIKLLRYAPNELSFEMQSDSDGWLLVTDRWARCWTAEVNSQPVEMFGGNFVFRAIQVRQGLNHVRFIYQPRGFPWLVILSWGTLGTVALASIISWMRRKKLVLSTEEAG